jgi:hypothetical protein
MVGDPQVPRPGAVFLDHVAWFVHDMAAAGRMFERLGFVLTPYTEHRNATPDGGSVPAGTANRCAMLERGYIEMLTAVPGSETVLATQLRDALKGHEGVHLMAFTCADAQAERARLAAAGFDPLPAVNLRRTIATEGGGAGVSAFSVVRTPPQRMPEGRIQFLVHHTPDLVWQPGLISRANAVEALTGILVVVDDVAEVAGRFARYTGRSARPVPGGALIQLDRGRVAFARPQAAWTHRSTVLPPPPVMAAVALRSRDLAASRAYFIRQGIRLDTDARDHLVIDPDDAAGCELVIHAEGADERLYSR